MTPALQPVILCGGAGTRLWPLSRESYPKQFLSLRGSRTMLQDTVLRMQGLGGAAPPPLPPIVVCNTEHRFIVASQLDLAGVRNAQILLEPVGKNTAPALTIAALQALAGSGDPVLLAMPADHVISDLPAFHQAAQHAYTEACAGAIVTFGIVPDRAETGYGYMKCHVGHGERAEVLHIEQFVEKPDLAAAQAYLSAGNFLWNSGLFAVKASQWLAAMSACRPDILDACVLAMQYARRDLDFIRPDAAAFESCPADSIDYAVMERSSTLDAVRIPVRAVPLDAGWTDVGAWEALWSLLPRDSDGNATVGDALLEGCQNTLLMSTSRLVAGVGLNGVVVVETPDAILVADKRCAQNVKHIVASLKKQSHPQASQHRKVHRPWGWYDALDRGDRFQVKRIVVNPGARLSVQMHYHRAEHWVVVKGVAEITNGDETYLLAQNESTFIPVGRRHCLANPGIAPLEIIEVQSGDYLGEDDIVRFDDIYGRPSGEV
ncbi:mannose-1-phosphate guanylyltransferase/mannose-6-phosphate isomerase [Acidovorax sp. 106]|uniref:mannose-1-phosphate guanylyltransferase/mannose-6-phosphate isomerase n=1 Tax=Acidovorax sp. 106 TaxID=2135637 RepID=UPI000EB3A44E|nr:mannose-1-phosphate guanylyltransferase/mannose-6-phosphate isomerase [Acidovorax sp. 106]RLJ38647.1 mannose-1-phosphate guanylyltransferase/mannose-6-phosphate isomerase [Acidovorax sp. 106]